MTPQTRSAARRAKARCLPGCCHASAYSVLINCMQTRIFVLAIDYCLQIPPPMRSKFAADFCLEGTKQVCCSQSTNGGTCKNVAGWGSMCCQTGEAAVVVQIPRICMHNRPLLCVLSSASVLTHPALANILQNCASWPPASGGAAPQTCRARPWTVATTASAATPRAVSDECVAVHTQWCPCLTYHAVLATS